MIKIINNTQINTISGGECSKCMCMINKEKEFTNYLQRDQSSLGMTARLIGAYAMASAVTDDPSEISIGHAASPKDCNNKCSHTGYISGYCKQ